MTFETPLLWVLLGLPWLAVAGLLALSLRTARRLARLEDQRRRLLSGAQGESLEALLDAHWQRVEQALETIHALQGQVEGCQQGLRAAVQHVGIVRFNPFGNTGGDQSFALALADGRGDGVVICNLHGRGESRLYAKPLHEWRSTYALSDEEQQAVQRAQQGAEG